MAEILKEQKIDNLSPEAIAYRNMHRPKVDKLFNNKNKTNVEKRRKYFDNKARQLWRRIIKESNSL